MKPRIFSGMQPSGELHIGNWLGALRQWVELSRADTHEAIFCVVDAHAITVDYKPKVLQERIIEAAIGFLAAGVDPDRSVLFVQSDVRQHTELAWYLSTTTQMGELNRMTQFKDKSEQHKHNVNAALFTYPVLMAADILLYRASLVPVGDDQVQHLELARDIARRFNKRYGRVFPEPKPRLSKTPRIMGLDGASKMAKSKGNTIAISEPSGAVWKKLRGAYTDPQRLRRGDPGRPEVCNVFTIHQAISSEQQLGEIEQGCRAGTMGCGDCKKLLHENLMRELTPVQQRLEQWRGKPERVREILGDGAARCRRMAEETMVEVRGRMGLGSGASLP